MSNKDAVRHLGAVTPQTRAIALEIAEHLDSLGLSLPRYGAPYSGPVMHGYDPNPRNTEHHSKRAIDVMVMAPGKIGDAVVDFVWANRSRYDLQHIIWKQRIKSTKNSPGVWRGMSDRGSPTENHMDHPHILTGPNPKIAGKPASGGGGSSASAYYQPKGVSMSVKEIQKAVGVKSDGYYGDDTKAAVKVLQRRLKVTADGLWGPATEKAYKGGSSAPAPAKPSTPAKKPKPAAKAPKFPLPKGHYFGPKSGPNSSVSGYYSHKADLKKWQAQMRKRGWSITADGLYGPATKKVARQFQKEKGLGVDGLIGAKTWAAAWTEKVT